MYPKSKIQRLLWSPYAFIFLAMSVPFFNVNLQHFVNNIQVLIRHKVNVPKLRQDIVSLIEKDMQIRNDGTSLIGTFVRLSWHSAGTYSHLDGTGGSNGGRIRFSPEKNWEANAGLNVAIEALEEIKVKHPFLSYGDLYTFAGVVSVEYAGGPTIPYQFGRVDAMDGSMSPPDGRLPDADKGSFEKTSAHMRDVFYRMGFNDREMVCLIGAHTLGRCHRDRSGYWGPWNKAENKFNNALFSFLLNMQWTEKKTHEGKWWSGPLQYENPTGELMMLPSCMAMIHDEKLRKYVEMYSNDQELFYKDFSAAYGKLLSLGFHDHDKK